ncbi:zinc metallopeptidase, partial [uncultured Olegusella sp.]|uniref:zinc metallopeptidase n=1 Tax=uncultured Olegusella sp. TaxID=1979846 RepID=UPI00260A0DED
MYYGDGAYILLLIVTAVLGMGTQAYIKSTYKKWSEIDGSDSGTGAEVARRMLDSMGAHDVGIVRTSGHLSDYYDPRDNKLHLSDENFDGGSVASVAVACHEAGHAAVSYTHLTLPTKPYGC